MVSVRIYSGAGEIFYDVRPLSNRELGVVVRIFLVAEKPDLEAQYMRAELERSCS